MAVTESQARHYELADPDVRLMLEVRNGSATAFEELMLRYQNRVVTVLEHMVGRRGQAEDLAQDVFLRVYRARHTYVPGSRFSTWLFTITNNVAANALRSQSRRREVHLGSTLDSGGVPRSTLEQMAVESSGQMPTRQADKSETRQLVRQAVSQLSQRQRMAVLLSKFEEMSYAEIAEAMQMTPQAIKSLLSRARVNLKEALAGHIDPGKAP